MAKRTTKADVILQGARARLELAKAHHRAALEQVRVAEAVLHASEEAYQALEVQLARVPSAPKPSKPRAARSDKGSKRGLPEAQKVNGGDGDANSNV